MDAAQIEQTYAIMYIILDSFLCQVLNFNLSEDRNSSAPHFMIRCLPQRKRSQSPL